MLFCSFFFFNDTATTEIYTLSLHDALPVLRHSEWPRSLLLRLHALRSGEFTSPCGGARSEEHTSELQSLRHLVCRLLLEKKKTTTALTPRASPHSEAPRPHTREAYAR